MPITSPMGADVSPILQLEVPMIVVLGRRELSTRDVVGMVPGAIIELPKSADDELELLVNNKVVGLGRAVKVGENFGIRITFIGDLKKRIAALGGDAAKESSAKAEQDLDALAEALLQNQG